MWSYEHTPFCYTNANKSLLNSCDTYLKLLYDKFLTNESRLELINCILSIKTNFSSSVKSHLFF